MNYCSGCKEKHRLDAGICKTATGSDGLPVSCVGPWAEDKHYYLKRYCEIFAKGMKNKWQHRYFLDLFSGPGLSRSNDTGIEVDGSPLVALEEHNFTDYVFVESNVEVANTLRTRVGERTSGRSVSFVQGDVNQNIDELVAQITNSGSLCLAFVDPFTIQIKMATLAKLAENRRVDFLIHFPYGTYLKRVLSTQRKEDTNQDIDAFFGCADWRQLCRTGNLRVGELLELYESQLATIGYRTSDNYPNMKNRKSSSLYCLVLASRHELALDFWKKTCAIESSGQRKLL